MRRDLGLMECQSIGNRCKIDGYGRGMLSLGIPSERHPFSMFSDFLDCVEV